ncbi:MAG: hypothetical protein FWG61_08795 [Firmicutes bacterium]|nr:hypothetical protein [Bacillota bacterium]
MPIDKSLYREFSSKEDAELWGKKHYGEWADAYKENMLMLKKIFNSYTWDVVELYCGFNYWQMNSILRETPDARIFSKDVFKPMIEVLAVIISWAPRVPENIVVYRGVADLFVKKLYDARKKNWWAAEEGFLSTSLCKIIEMDHGYDALLRIYLPKGVPGAYVPCVTGRAEHELLMPPDSGMRLIDDKPFILYKICREKINGYPVYDCELTYMI